MKRTKEFLHLAFAFSLAFAAFACAKKAKPDADASLTGAGPACTGGCDSDSNNAMGLVTVHFPFDSSSIDGADKDTLKQDLSILKTNMNVHVQIEGHCDQRGGVQYNMALGERRAEAVKKYLAGMGVSPGRITTISMGKEKPVDTAETEEAYAKNRRANFVVTQ